MFFQRVISLDANLLDNPLLYKLANMTMHLSLTNLALRVWIAFFAAVYILTSVNADTVNLYDGDDVGVVFNSTPNVNVFNVYGSVTHSQKVAIGVLTINGNGGTRQIDVQSLDPSAPYVFTKPTDDLQLYMTDIEYCGNADQNVRSIFVKDQYTGSSSNSMAMTFHKVTISSFNAPDPEAYSVFNISNTITGITLLSDAGYPNTFCNNRGCARAKVINFNPASTANGSTGDWYFNNNFANNGSVLNCYQLLFKDQGNYSFTGNSAVNNGGAIFSTGDYEGTGSVSSAAMCHLIHSRAKFNFDSNTAGEKGGAIYGYESEIRVGGEKTFINNRAGIDLDGNILSNNSGHGGAICSEGPSDYGYVLLSGGVSTFKSNLAYGDGGAIYSNTFTWIFESLSKFSDNSAHYGGAIYSEKRAYLYYSTMTFSNNTANQGGAIYSPYIELWGDTSSMTFTGNYGAFYDTVNDKVCGNDIYCPVNDDYSPPPSGGDECTNLAFVEAGAFSFDGGIYIERGNYDDNPNNTIIREAQVTIAGRANDSTNYYQLRRAEISNGGKLTAKLDEIEGINGIFVMDAKTEKLELNVTGADPKKLTMSAVNVDGSAQDDDLAVQGSGVIEKTGDGTLQILAEAEGLVRAESFVVSSGRLDYRGYFTGAVEVGGSEAEAVFSPGNSVGDANVDGNVSILNNGVALFEFGEFPGIDSDSNHDVLYITNTNRKFSAGDQRISLFFENSVAEDWSYEDCKYLLVSGANLPDGDYTRWLDDNYTDLFSLLSEDHNLYLVYPLPEPIPEPSTIALLLLGVAGLMYWRKRKN